MTIDEYLNESNGGSNLDLMGIRHAYKTLSHSRNNIVQSTDIATACLCNYLFRLSYPFGVTSSNDDYVVAGTTHEIMSLIAPKIILNHWSHATNDADHVVKLIEDDSDCIIQRAIGYKREQVKSDGKHKPLDHTFDYEIYDRIHGLLVGFVSRIMKKWKQPKRIMTEITITNVKAFHEGRIDALLEYDDNKYSVVDWKGYSLTPAKESGKEKWQLLANLFLANYRYTGNEDDWSKCLFGSVVYYEGAYIPRLLPPTEKAIFKLKKDRQFAYDIMCGNNTKLERPDFCAVCDIAKTQSAGECFRYQREAYLKSQGQLPADYDRIRRFALATRYKICRERGEVYRHKFVISQLTEKYGEVLALKKLEEAKIIYCNYKFEKIDGTRIVLTKDSNDFYLEARDIVRLIHKEDNIPLLACISESGSISEVNCNILIVDLRQEIVAERVKMQLFDNIKNRLVIIPDEINLTRRMLNPLHKLHRLASDIMIPDIDLYKGNGKTEN
jgi:hypothetical protein